MSLLEAELTWTGHAFERGIQVRLEGSRIAEVGHGLGSDPRRLDNRALLPGFVNAHSHAFQRGLRGLGETFPQRDGSFWSWREAMYELVDSMTPDMMYEISRHAFGEMLDCGMTTVGEFHYLHHDDSESGFIFDEVILDAARDAGIRIVLLMAYYNTGAIGQPLQGGQRRFRCASVDDYWRQMDRLERLVDGEQQRLGVVAHSIRAVPLNDLAALHAEAHRRGLVFHLHIEEQVAEIEQSIAAYGRTPMAALFDAITPDARLTGVHCTHTAPDDMHRFIDAGANICICPLTEANLGDGIADLPAMVEQGGHVCLGSDSNARISMLEEMRWLEYAQRLNLQKRGVCIDETGAIAPWLVAAATINGARSLGLDAGRIKPGMLADFCTVNLNDPSLAGADEESLAAAIICGARDTAIAETCVGGEWR